MLRGLQGHSIAMLGDESDQKSGASIVLRTLEQAGATIHRLQCPAEQDLHGGRYAALVLTGGADGSECAASDERLVQLVREFLATDKPVAVLGDAIRVLERAGGVAGRTLSAPSNSTLKESLERAGATLGGEPVHVDDALVTAGDSARAQDFAERVVREFTDRLEERQLDEMSDLSFPASDPPASTPSTIGRGPSADTDSRP